MANVDRPNGFKPVMHLTGAPFNGQGRKYMIGAADANAAAVGDLVILSDAAATDGYAAVEPVNAATITAAVIVGAIISVLPFNDTGGVSSGASPTLDTPLYRVASTKRFVIVADSPDLLFEVQEDSVSGNIALASVGLNAGFVAATPNTTTGFSNFKLDSSSVATTNTLPLQIMGVVQRVDNVVPDTNGRFLVRINTHAYHGSVTAV